jgi:hypothetical protein
MKSWVAAAAAVLGALGGYVVGSQEAAPQPAVDVRGIEERLTAIEARLADVFDSEGSAGGAAVPSPQAMLQQLPAENADATRARLRSFIDKAEAERHDSQLARAAEYGAELRAKRTTLGARVAPALRMASRDFGLSPEQLGELEVIADDYLKIRTDQVVGIIESFQRDDQTALERGRAELEQLEETTRQSIARVVGDDAAVALVAKLEQQARLPRYLREKKIGAADYADQLLGPGR